jgi:hypothetical protein
MVAISPGDDKKVGGNTTFKVTNLPGAERKVLQDGVPFGALLHPDNPPSGAYGGFSLAWFPTLEGSLMSLVVGTRGLQPDEGILTRPGHRRRVAALRRYLTRSGVDAWAKADPAAVGVKMPHRHASCSGNR